MFIAEGDERWGKLFIIYPICSLIISDAVLCSAVTKGQWSWWVDWVSLMLRCDQRSVELMGWLDEIDAPLWPKVSGADGLTGWDIVVHHLSVVVCQVLLFYFVRLSLILTNLTNDTRAWGYKVTEWILKICIKLMLIRSNVLQNTVRLRSNSFY